MALQVAELGASPMCPHTNTRFFDGTMSHEFWLDATMELMRRCDAVFMLSTWKSSIGAQAEFLEAQRLGMPVFETMRDLEEFINDDTEGEEGDPSENFELLDEDEDPFTIKAYPRDEMLFLQTSKEGFNLSKYAADELIMHLLSHRMYGALKNG